MPRGPGPGMGDPSSGATRVVAACLCLALLVVSACSSPADGTADRSGARLPAPSSPATAGGPKPTTSVTPTPTPTPTVEPVVRRSFSVRRVLADTRAIEHFGVRVGGGAAEHRAADYAADRLRSMGYRVTIEKFSVPGGTSRNVTARVRGGDKRTLVLGGHLDTRPTTPGANDDAAGCAIVLEMARILAEEKLRFSVEFTLFGSEEYNDGASRDHHRGSRLRVARLTKAQRARIVGMISVDVVGYGERLYVRTMGIGPRTMSAYLLRRAGHLGIGLRYLRDPGPTGWSDHEPYEKAGIPAVWIERLQDPQYHKSGDTTEHLRSSALRECGLLVLDAVRSLGPAEARRIAAHR